LTQGLERQAHSSALEVLRDCSMQLIAPGRIDLRWPVAILGRLAEIVAIYRGHCDARL